MAPIADERPSTPPRVRRGLWMALALVLVVTVGGVAGLFAAGVFAPVQWPVADSRVRVRPPARLDAAVAQVDAPAAPDALAAALAPDVTELADAVAVADAMDVADALDGELDAGDAAGEDAAEEAASDDATLDAASDDVEDATVAVTGDAETSREERRARRRRHRRHRDE